MDDDNNDKINRAFVLFDLINEASKKYNVYDVFILVDERIRIIEELINHEYIAATDKMQMILSQTEKINLILADLIVVIEDALRKQISSANALKSYQVSQFLGSQINHL